jgi:hypothetical protein
VVAILSLGRDAPFLMREAAAYAKRLGMPVAHVNFKGGDLGIPGIFGQFDLDLGQKHLPYFSAGGASKTHLLKKDLRAKRQPVLVIFDNYEDVAGNKPVVDWLDQQFFPEVETSLGLAVIVAGQQIPEYSNVKWREFVRHLRLQPITEIEHWVSRVDQHFPDFRKKGADLRTVLMITQGDPLLVSSCCEAIAKN